MTPRAPEIPPDLSIAFVLLRLTRGLKQEQVAKAAGITSSALSEYERGKKAPELRSVRRVVHALGYRLSAIERIEDLLRDLELESVVETSGEDGQTLVPVPRFAVKDGPARGRRVAALVGQAATGFCLLLFDLLGNLGQRGQGPERRHHRGMERFDG